MNEMRQNYFLGGSRQTGGSASSLEPPVTDVPGKRKSLEGADKLTYIYFYLFNPLPRAVYIARVLFFCSINLSIG